VFILQRLGRHEIGMVAAIEMSTIAHGTGAESLASDWLATAGFCYAMCDGAGLAIDAGAGATVAVATPSVCVAGLIRFTLLRVADFRSGWFHCTVGFGSRFGQFGIGFPSWGLILWLMSELDRIYGRFLTSWFDDYISGVSTRGWFIDCGSNCRKISNERFDLILIIIVSIYWLIFFWKFHRPISDWVGRFMLLFIWPWCDRLVVAISWWSVASSQSISADLPPSDDLFVVGFLSPLVFFFPTSSFIHFDCWFDCCSRLSSLVGFGRCLRQIRTQFSFVWNDSFMIYEAE